ncbi:MAG: FAD-dependent oxidoreductase [Bacteroidales bacterium]|nr:FAD-dependent oxidoreductase [Bacteroidales bacterium]
MYFLAIMGGGPAGYTAAEKAAKAGKQVVLFEQNNLGGTCLNVGCIPTKTLLYSAKQYFNATHADKYVSRQKMLRLTMPRWCNASKKWFANSWQVSKPN